MRTALMAVGTVLVLAGCTVPQAPVTVYYETKGAWIEYMTNDPVNATTGQYYWWTNSSSAADVPWTATVTVKKVSGSSATGFGIVFRLRDTSNCYRVIVATNGQYAIQKKVAGTTTDIMPWTTPATATINAGLGSLNTITVSESSLGTYSVSFNGTPEPAASFTGDGTLDNDPLADGTGFYTKMDTATAENFPTGSVDVFFQLSYSGAVSTPYNKP